MVTESYVHLAYSFMYLHSYTFIYQNRAAVYAIYEYKGLTDQRVDYLVFNIAPELYNRFSY